ncbi:transferase [Aureococcus anophagefferens]|nr:transferase [Aureococcus anophagefferens]
MAAQFGWKFVQFDVQKAYLLTTPRHGYYVRTPLEIAAPPARPRRETTAATARMSTASAPRPSRRSSPSTSYPAGFAGAGVFFVISGFAAPSADRRKDRGVRAFLGDFYARRVGRLAPALAVATAAGAVALAAVGKGEPRLGEYFNTGLLGLVGGANVFCSQ